MNMDPMKLFILITLIFSFVACSDSVKKNNNSESDAGNNDTGKTTVPFEKCKDGFYEVDSIVNSDTDEDLNSHYCREIPSSCTTSNTNNNSTNNSTSTNNGTTNNSTNNAQNNQQDGTTQYCRCLIDNTPGSRDYCECDGDKNLVSCFTSG